MPEQDRREAYQFWGYAKGVRGIYMRPIHMNLSMVMNIKKIRRLMKKYGLKCPTRKANPYRRMAKALKTSYVAPNLLSQEFEAHGPKAILLTDITHISNDKAPAAICPPSSTPAQKSFWPGY